MTSEEYEKWAKDNNIFVSKVIRRLFFGKFGGIYILNAYKFNWFPRFFGMKNKYYIECGINWLGWLLEFQRNK